MKSIVFALVLAVTALAAPPVHAAESNKPTSEAPSEDNFNCGTIVFGHDGYNAIAKRLDQAVNKYCKAGHTPAISSVSNEALMYCCPAK